jgi:thiol-disulfide isomerase/thioredoxin
MLGRSYLIVFVILTAMAAVAGSDDGEPAPRFHAKTTSGESYTNESIRGKVVLLEFWTTWCPYCKNEEALVDGIDHEFADKGLVRRAVLVVILAHARRMWHSPRFATAARPGAAGPVRGQFRTLCLRRYTWTDKCQSCRRCFPQRRAPGELWGILRQWSRETCGVPSQSTPRRRTD